MLTTIKGKLTLLLAVVILGFGILGYEMIKLSHDGKMAATRLLAIGEVDEGLTQCMMELRGYQLLGKPEGLKGFEDNYQIAIKSIDSLVPILLSKVNQDKIASIKQGTEAWYKLNIPRLEILKKYGTKTNESSFAQEHKAEYETLATLTKESASTFDKVMNETDALKESVNKINFERINTNETIGEIVLGIVLIVVLIIFFLITNSIKASVAKAKEGCEKIRRTKDLSTKIEVGVKDEISEIVEAINAVVSDVAFALNEAKGNAVENASVAEELSNTSLQIGKRAEEESNVVSQTTRDASVVAQEMDEASSQAKKVKEVTFQAQKSLSIAQDLLDETITQLGQTAQAEAAINERLNHLAGEAQQVRSVLDVIGDIADQTNLLALNAAIEAARAGEHGRGFAVVADEVRKLAERTQKSLVDTNATVNVIVQSIGDISGEMNGNAKRINELTEFSTKVTTQTNDAVAMLAQSVEATDEVVEKANANVKLIQSAVIEKISTINELSSSNARSVEEIASAAEHLSKLAGSLSSTLSQFKTA